MSPLLYVPLKRKDRIKKPVLLLFKKMVVWRTLRVQRITKNYLTGNHTISNMCNLKEHIFFSLFFSVYQDNCRGERCLKLDSVREILFLGNSIVKSVRSVKPGLKMSLVKLNYKVTGITEHRLQTSSTNSDACLCALR